MKQLASHGVHVTLTMDHQPLAFLLTKINLVLCPDTNPVEARPCQRKTACDLQWTCVFYLGDASHSCQKHH